MPGVVTAGRVVDDRYLLIEAMEEGGMGILWRAEDLISERLVTVKELRFPDPLDHMQRRALAARVRREARAMSAVDHPGLARIIDVILHDQRSVMTVGAPTADMQWQESCATKPNEDLRRWMFWPSDSGRRTFPTSSGSG